MVYLFFVLFLIILLFLYFFYQSFSFQILIHKYRVKSYFVEDFCKSVKGKFRDNGYFAPSHKIISVKEYKSLSNRQKINFSKCYNIVTFKTADVDWEIFYNLIKEDLSFIEVFNMRAFPKHFRIKSEGNVEKNYSRINVFTNNHYLTKILESSVSDNLKWLMRYNSDILLISYDNLHFKAFLNSNKLTTDRALDMVKALNNIKSKIYKKDVIEY